MTTSTVIALVLGLTAGLAMGVIAGAYYALRTFKTKHIYYTDDPFLSWELYLDGHDVRTINRTKL